MTRAIGADLIWDGTGFVADSVLLVDGDVFSGVVPRTEAEGDVEEWGAVALFPGTVNAHGHAFQNLFKGRADDRPFASWRDDVLYPLSEGLSAEDIYNGALFAFAEALLAGTTTTVDFFYLHDEGNENADKVIRAALDIGIGLVFARTFYDVDAPTAAPLRFREPADVAAARTLELAERYAAEPSISVQPAPHSLHAASPETIATTLEVARELDVPCHLHLAEAEYEVEMIEERYGTTPVRLLQKEGLLDPRLITIHTVWVDDEEIDMLAEAGVGVVHCPGANAFLGDGVARAADMLRRGMRMALGPDGGCANNRQSVFEEMRMASLVAKARACDGGAFDAETAIALGTRGGADLLGLPVGTFDAGSRADLVALDLMDLSLQPRSQLTKHIVNSMMATAIAKVMVGGRVVVEDGRTLAVSHAEVIERIERSEQGFGDL